MYFCLSKICMYIASFVIWIICQISNMENRGAKNMRRIKIGEGGNNVEVNLWGQYADCALLQVNQTVKMVALEVQEYKDFKKLDTTPSFRLMVNNYLVKTICSLFLWQKKCHK